MKICPVCQTTNDDRTKFCYRDGTNLEDVKKCECGEQLTPVDKFCPMCGKSSEVAVQS